MLTIYKGQLAPSIEDTINADGAAFDLTGATVKFSMRSADSGTLVVDAATAVIVDAATGTVRYDWQVGDTAAAGFYVFWWTVTPSGGEAQDTPESDLEIADHAVAANALCTLTDVHLAMEIPASDTSLDGVITEYVNEASELILKSIARQIVPVETAVAKTFKVGRKGRVVFTPYVLQSATEVMLHPEQSQEIVSSDDYQLEPYPAVDGVYTALRISPWIPLVSLRQLKFGNAYCQITGTWGYASVPEPVKRACVITVRTWLRKDARGMAGSVGGSYYSGQELTPDLPSTYALPAAARKLIARYQRTLGAA